jgi:hypothetical protein
MNNDLPRWATAFVMPMLNLLSALLVAALVIHMLGEARPNRWPSSSTAPSSIRKA